MKKLVIFLLVLASCTPVRYVNFERHHNYYETHRFNTYTVPIWVPGRGAILETRIIRPRKPIVYKQLPPRQSRKN